MWWPFGIAILGFVQVAYLAWKGHKEHNHPSGLRPRQTHCGYGYSEQHPYECARAEVSKQAGFRVEGCRVCVNDQPRWVSVAEQLRAQQDRDDGWVTPEGKYCDKDVYLEATRRSITPLQVLEERAATREAQQ
ncbi:hypothetical protein [Caulobacter sp. UNC279MFTsu5.1]|uniref:hypothetical protein n=1 Tax=Caulobacter sp. UNC279MFTsu5.1 TaxID=1502775 RepID=UPI001160B9A2|nr:hypothetical protein [Caulobacter sp. UNC279MFTsu5.1]